jgi:hypothetical protein
MRTALICHENDLIALRGITRWLSSFSELAGVVVLREPASRMRQRIRREWRRSGALGLLDVLAFRLYYRWRLAAGDDAWTHRKLAEMEAQYPASPDAPIHFASSPNEPSVEAFLKSIRPDIMPIFCKTILKERIFTIPTHGTWVMHPGICPEYRNAHGCFWALVRRDLARVGMTLLRVDAGIDTGAVHGFFSYPFDEVNESHYVIQQRVVLDNLEALRQRYEEIFDGSAQSLDTRGRESAEWGQPRLSAWLRWKSAARKEAGK